MSKRCPKCQAVFRGNIHICPTCNVPLIDSDNRNNMYNYNNDNYEYGKRSTLSTVADVLVFLGAIIPAVFLNTLLVIAGLICAVIDLCNPPTAKSKKNDIIVIVVSVILLLILFTIPRTFTLTFQ